MMRKLLLFLAMFCVSIGTWATSSTGSTTWCQYNSYADQENVLTIYVSEPGELAAAIAAQDFTNVQILHISARERTASLLQLTDEDKAALANVNVKTIEMMRAYVEPYTITNSNVERIILPYNWTKEQVKAVGLANTSANFEACISMNDQDAYDQRTGDAALIAYLKKPNTLKDAIMRTWNDTHNYAPLGNTVHQGGGDCSRLKYLTVMGNICARDISSQGTYDENGHYVTNGVPDENSDTYNKNTDGGDYYVAGETPGAFAANTKNLYVLDLRDAYVPNEYAADIVFPYSQMGGSNLREIWMPEDSRFNTVPADYLNISCNVRQICIPGNIKYIKTRAFAGNSGTGRMCYIWTTGPDPLVKYDNGAAFVNGDETTWKYMNNAGEGNVAMTASDYNQFQYGTFTLPAGLELIERFAFSQSTSVSDVYVLNPVAPECHVDAFNCTMYLANNTLQSQYIKDGIVTREAYRNDGSGTEYKWVTILHYPRETTDPNIQRYTDPTREYSIATGDRDGNGSTIYYPNHSEMSYAYLQGSYGYLWKGWDDSRNWYDQSLKAGYGEGLPLTESSHHPDRAGAQATANQRWIDNEYNADQKADRSFYDVTTGGNNQPGETTAPAGLDPYYENRYSGYNGVLYPQAETVEVTDENGNPVMETVPDLDANGNPQYDLDNTNGTYVEDVRQDYIERENGQYCKGYVAVDEQFYNANKNLIYYSATDSYPEDTNGGYYYVNGNYITIAEGESGSYDWWWNNGNPKTRYRKETTYSKWTYNYWYYQGLYILDYVEWTEAAGDVTRYNLEDVTYYKPATAEQIADATVNKYVERMKQVQKQNVIKANDYRGWHQFILTGRSYDSIVPMEPLRSFISDNDWWTICVPYDLRYNDMVKFFGTDRTGFDKKIPYLSKLMYVVRDVENQKITLMFSKNLMEYKEQFLAENGTLTGKEQFPAKNELPTGRVHGVVNDETPWTPEELAQDPIILHAGVPYLIKPNMMVDNTTGKYKRQFDIFKSTTSDLYERLHESEELSGTDQMNLVYKGIYTVPAYVVGYDPNNEASSEESLDDDGELVITMKDGTTITYQDSKKDAANKITYKGKEVSYRISNENKYTFVGSFYKSVMPQYCYFLGWDSNANRAAFWYSAVQDMSGWNWNNETGIICPNFDSLPAESQLIHKATAVEDPARWTLTNKQGVSSLSSDDFPGGAGVGGAKSYTMDFGATNYFEWDEATGVSEMVVKPLFEETKVYDTNGRFMGNSMQSLPKGVYIVNGKKYVVK